LSRDSEGMLIRQHEEYAANVGILVENPHVLSKCQPSAGTVMQPSEYLDEGGEMSFNRI